MPFDREQPLNPINRRISLIVMNRDAEERFHRAAEAAGATAAEETVGAGIVPPLPSSPALDAR
jgi:chemotaxis protein MotB